MSCNGYNRLQWYYNVSDKYHWVNIRGQPDPRIVLVEFNPTQESGCSGCRCGSGCRCDSQPIIESFRTLRIPGLPNLQLSPDSSTPIVLRYPNCNTNIGNYVSTCSSCGRGTRYCAQKSDCNWECR